MKPRSDKIPRWVDRTWQKHVKTIKKPVPGNLAQADGHGLRLVEITTTHFECQCGKKLEKT